MPYDTFCLIYWCFTDTSSFQRSYCHPKHQIGPFFHETLMNNEKTKTFSMELSLIRPANVGCYFTVFYDDTILEDKIYLLSERRLITQNNIWHVTPKSNYSYNYHQYIVTKSNLIGIRFLVWNWTLNFDLHKYI